MSDASARAGAAREHAAAYAAHYSERDLTRPPQRYTKLNPVPVHHLPHVPRPRHRMRVPPGLRLRIAKLPRTLLRNDRQVRECRAASRAIALLRSDGSRRRRNRAQWDSRRLRRLPHDEAIAILDQMAPPSNGATMTDKSPKSKQRSQKQKKTAKARVATQAKSKQDGQGQVQKATTPKGKK